MPTTVIAEPVTNATESAIVAVVAEVTPAVDTWMKADPWFDWTPIFGLPFWIFIAAFFLLIFITVNALWFFRLKRVQAVKGYVTAMKMASQDDVMTWIISTTKNMTIECLKKRDTVLSFYDPLNITKWVHTARESVVHIGGKGGVIVSEDYYKTRDMVSEIALCYGAEDYNTRLDELITKATENPESEEAALLKKLKVLYGEYPVSPISNYSDYENFGRRILEFLNPEGIMIPSYSIFDPNKFKKYFPAGLTATFKGGIIIRDARTLTLGNPKQGFWEKFIPLGVVIGLVIISIVAAWMVPL